MKKSLALVVLSASWLGCNGPNSTYEELGERVNTRGFGHKYSQPEDEEELVVAPGDVVSVQIAKFPEFSSIQPVRFEGVIEAPFVGPVKVAGLTATQIREKLSIALQPYIENVAIQVIPIVINSKRIYIYTTGRFGELVGRFFPLLGDLTVLDLITSIGGVNSLSDDCHIKITKADPRHPRSYDINVRDMILNGYTAGNIQLEPDDIVFLQPTFFARIASFLNVVTLPIRVLSGSLRDAATTVLFVGSGTLPVGRRGGGASGTAGF